MSSSLAQNMLSKPEMLGSVSAHAHLQKSFLFVCVCVWGELVERTEVLLAVSVYGHFLILPARLPQAPKEHQTPRGSPSCFPGFLASNLKAKPT